MAKVEADDTTGIPSTPTHGVQADNIHKGPPEEILQGEAEHLKMGIASPETKIHEDPPAPSTPEDQQQGPPFKYEVDPDSPLDSPTNVPLLAMITAI